MEAHKDFFDYVADHFEMTYWLPGNHEYYHSDISLRSGAFKEKIRDNVLLINNLAIEQDNIRLLFSTMWTKIGMEKEWQIQNGMSDFKVIRNKDLLLDVSTLNELHTDSVIFLERELRSPASDEKTIVVTHHVPTFQHYPEKYKDSVLNEAFVVEMTDLILETKPDYWVYGHSHSNTEEFAIGSTRLVTNQLGYVGYGEHLGFRNETVIKF